MNTNTMNKQEKSIAEKLNQLTNIATFWDDVRKHTTKSMSTAIMRKWEYLSDRRYAEILTGVEDVRAEVEEYGKPMRYYAPNGKEVFPKSTKKRSVTKCKDSNGKGILTGMIIRISNAANKSDNGLFFVAESPCDLSWKNQSVHVLRKIDEYGVELNYVSFYPLISFDENGNEITLHSDAEIVKITDTGFSEISQYFINKKMQANIKWNHTLSCFETVENRNKQNEEIEFYESVIGNIKNGFEASIAEENVEKPTSTEEQPESPKGESIMNNTEIPTIKNLSQLKKALKANSGMMFEILDHNKPERIGEIRKVTSVNSVNFTSRVIDESGEMTGKDIYVEFEKACYWKFEGEKISYLFTTGDVIMSFRFITENSIMNGNSVMPKYNTGEQPTTENLTAENLVTTEQPEEPKTAWTGRTDYAERRAEKAERYAERAEKARATADRLQKPINDMHGDIAFFTQPNINTSAGRAFTRQREKMFASFEKGFEERSKAEYYDTKAENLSKEPTAISSDDPEALHKLKDKLEKLTAEHKEHLAHNKALTKAIKNGTATRNSMGYYELNGKMTYFTTNETAEIRRLKDRISELESLKIPEDYEFDGGTVVFNTAENRVQILFDEIPDSETRENLKRNGFKWSPRQQAWQRMLNTTGIRTVKRLYPMPEKPTEENSVEETSQPTTENIVYPFVLVDTPTAQPETAEEKTVEEQPTENLTVAQPVITFDETLLSKARQMYYKVYVDSISDDGIYYIGSETEISGIRARIIPSDSWDDSITFYSAEKFAEYMNEELKLESEFWSDEATQLVEESATENQTAELPTETITVEDTEIAVDKIPEVILEYKGNSEKLAILKDKALSLGASVSSTENHLTIDTYENHRPEIESVATELGLKTKEEMHETFSTVQEKINEVGTIEQKNIIYKIPWGIYRRYSAEDIINVVLAKTSDILSIKTENRFKSVSTLIDSVAPMTTDKLISDNMEKSGAIVEQISQVKIAIQYIGNPDFKQELNDYIFSKAYSAEENSNDNSVANSNNTTTERKIRPPPFLKDFPKIRKEKR